MTIAGKYVHKFVGGLAGLVLSIALGVPGDRASAATVTVVNSGRPDLSVFLLDGEIKGGETLQIEALLSKLPSNQSAAIILNSHECGEERVGADCPECEAIAERKDEERRHLSRLGDGDGRAKANHIKPSDHKRTRVQTKISQGCEHHVATVHARSGSRPLPEEGWVDKGEGSRLEDGIDAQNSPSHGP